MKSALPQFRYHPDPLASGAVIHSNISCRCCGTSRGFIYVGPAYAIEDYHGAFCPWCIEDGAAANRFGVTFADDRPLRAAHVPEEVVATITMRTPGYRSWQTDEWLCHCGDAAAFCGDASVTEVATMPSDEKVRFLKKYRLDEDEWQEIQPTYKSGGDPGIYKFKCLHCMQVLFAMDCT